ncbi:MAG: hypothetical protein C4583_15105 [Anaerolineaceae bacterium]|nr:MAG: hypothetical protein C4583_15105 [Anaerolineaceae bacterium]
MRHQVYKERTTLRLTLLGILIAVIGAVLLIASSSWEPLSKSPEWQAIARDFGALFIASVAVALIWDLVARRAFVAELLSITQLAEDIEQTGLVGASAKWHGEIDWAQLFASSDDFELLFAYGRTWRNTHRVYLAEFATRKNTKARIALPDPDNINIMTELAYRFEITPEVLSQNIREAEQDFIEIFGGAQQAVDKLQIWRISTAPVWSYYRFDGIVIFTLYRHRRGRLEVPTLIVKKGGSLFEFFQQEFDALASENSQLCNRFFPPQIQRATDK